MRSFEALRWPIRHPRNAYGRDLCEGRLCRLDAAIYCKVDKDENDGAVNVLRGKTVLARVLPTAYRD